MSITTPLQAGIDAFTKYFDDELAARPDETWRSAGKATKKYPNGEDESFWREQGPQWLSDYYQWRISNPHYRIWKTSDGVPAIEMSIVVEVPDSSVTLKGFIDRVFINTQDGSLLIVDLKSGKSKQTSPLQLAFYRLGIKQQFDIDVRYGSYYAARDGGLDQIWDLEQFPPDLVSEWLRKADRMINEDLLLPSIGMQCNWCSMKPNCYVWNPAVPRPVGVAE